MAEITIANDVAEIAEELIGEFHPHIRSHGVRLICLKSDHDKAQKGRSVDAEIVPLGGRARFYSGFVDVGRAQDPTDGYDFEMTVYGSMWEGYTSKQRQACVDRELCKLVEKTVQHADGETTVIKLQDYDVKGFTDNLSRFGTWTTRIYNFVSKGKQLPLDLQAEPMEANAAMTNAESEAAGETPADQPRKLAAVK